ncbi:MAG: DUF3579 domain-containing protein [Proteobacteria bacterium]|nr:DUF3579 domain-containing protein [Pseudomonadota bacterium]
MPKSHRNKIMIEGITIDGKIFRPSDWAERICGHLSTFKNHRIYYSPLLKPCYKEGHRCVVVAFELKEKFPELFEHIMDFAKVNKLVITTKEI